MHGELVLADLEKIYYSRFQLKIIVTLIYISTCQFKQTTVECEEPFPSTF
jgi:hypothetical protein